MWTAKRVEVLTNLWADGFSASQIADRLGGITRNAVIGKVRRLGLTGCATAPRSSHRDVGQTRARRSPPARQANRRAPLQLDVSVLEWPAKHQMPVTPAVVEAVTAPSRHIGLLDLKESMCRWPIGDPASHDFHFCGCQKQAGSSYCEHHARIAFKPLSEGAR